MFSGISKWDHSESVSDYFGLVGEFDTLSDGEDVSASRERLITSCLRIVVQIAKNYSYDVEQFMDHIQDGNVGLIMAADRYDASKGPFIPYATLHIKNCIREAQMTSGSLVKTPRDSYRNYSKIRSMNELGITIDNIAKDLNISECAVESCLYYGVNEIPVESRDGNRHDEWVANFASTSQNDEDHKVELYRLAEKLDEILTERQAAAITGRAAGRSFKEIGDDIGVSFQAIQIYEKTARKKLFDKLG